MARLEARAGKHHLMIADAEGAEALLDLATPELMARVTSSFISAGTDYADKLAALEARTVLRRALLCGIRSRIQRVLQDARWDCRSTCGH